MSACMRWRERERGRGRDLLLSLQENAPVKCTCVSQMLCEFCIVLSIITKQTHLNISRLCRSILLWWLQTSERDICGLLYVCLSAIILPSHLNVCIRVLLCYMNTHSRFRIQTIVQSNPLIYSLGGLFF